MNRTTALPLICVFGTLLPAQEIQSGPEVGMKLTKVKVYAASGPFQGQEFDAAEALGTGPGALLFAKTLNRETAPIIRALDSLTSDYSLLGFRSFTVWLTDDRTDGEQRIKTVSQAINMHNPMTLSLDGSEGPGNYAINRNATLTLVMVKGGEVRKCLAFTDTGQKDIPLVTRAIESVTGKMPTTDAERAKLLPDDVTALKRMVGKLWADNQRLKKQLENQRNRNRRNRGQRNRNMRRGNQGEGEMRRRQPPDRDADHTTKKPLPGKHPDDPKLMGLLRRSIRVKTKEEIDELFAEIEKEVGDDKDRREAIAQGFIRILGATTYGTDAARARAKAFCAQAGHAKVVDKKATEAGRKKVGARREGARKDG